MGRFIEASGISVRAPRLSHQTAPRARLAELSQCAPRTKPRLGLIIGIRMSKWTLKNMPSQVGRSVVVTGTGGLGFEDALALAKAGAEVIIAGRDAAKGTDAVARINQAAPSTKVTFEVLDLASLRSVANFAS